MEDCLNRYNALLAQLEPYPEWHAKVVEEVGHWFHMIHNNLSESDSKRSIFLKMVKVVSLRTDKSTSCDQCDQFRYHSHIAYH